MDSSLQSKSPDNSDMKPSFRKPSNDTANRKYRRHSPSSGSHSSSSDGNPKHYSKVKASDRWKRKDDGRDLDRNSSRSRSGKGSDSYRNSHDHHRHDDYSRHRRHADDEDKGYQRSSRSGQESRGSGHSDHSRQDNELDRSRENWRNNERYSRDDDRGDRNKDKERETAVLERHRHNEKDLSSDRSSSGRRQANSNTDEIKAGERERQRERGGGRDDRKDQRRSNDYASSHDEFRGHAKDLIEGRDSGASRMKETHRNSNREPDGPKEDTMQKRKHDDWERDNSCSSSYKEREARNEQYQDRATLVNEDQDSSAKKLKSFHSDKAVNYAEDGQSLSKSSPFAAAEKPPTSSKQVQENVTKLASEPVASSTSEVEASNDLNAAKVAAMKAAELVNRNLVGGSYMSTDQKKKLLWGNKKNTAAEESGNHWGGMSLFSDRERQEKFNKLMGVKGDAKLEQKPDDKDSSSLLQAEKQEQLQLDLEKQYTAGLRRRDGRTVGLGL